MTRSELFDIRGRPQMMSRTFGQFWTPLPPSLGFFYSGLAHCCHKLLNVHDCDVIYGQPLSSLTITSKNIFGGFCSVRQLLRLKPTAGCSRRGGSRSNQPNSLRRTNTQRNGQRDGQTREEEWTKQFSHHRCQFSVSGVPVRSSAFRRKKEISIVFNSNGS